MTLMCIAEFSIRHCVRGSQGSCLQIVLILLFVSSNPGDGPKNAVNFFSQQTFTHFFFAFAFVIPKGMLTNNVDLQKGGEANFTSSWKDLAHCGFI